jgi:hypothetical protein
LTLILSIVPFASVKAQSASEGIDYCQIMKNDDCQILVNSAETMSGVGSFAFDMSLNMNFDMPEMGMGELDFGINGSGMLSLDTESFSEMQSLALNDPSAYMQQMPQLLDAMIAGIDGEAYFTLTLPEMFGAMVGTTEMPLNLLISDGVYAVDVASLADAVGEDANGMQWAGLDLNGVYTSLMGGMEMPAGTSNMSFDASMLTDALSITRLADSEVNGTPVAVFEMVLDYGELLNAGEMKDMLTEMYLGMGMTQAEIDSTLSLLNDIEITFQQYVGLVDSYNYRLDMAMDFAMSGEMMGEPTAGDMSMGFDMSITMSDFNIPVDIQIPADAMIMPFDMMMGMSQ